MNAETAGIDGIFVTEKNGTDSDCDTNRACEMTQPQKTFFASKNPPKRNPLSFSAGSSFPSQTGIGSYRNLNPLAAVRNRS